MISRRRLFAGLLALPPAAGITFSLARGAAIDPDRLKHFVFSEIDCLEIYFDRSAARTPLLGSSK